MSTELTIELPKTNALQVFTEPKGIDPYIEKIRKEALSHVPDLSTKQGRAAIASIAMKVAKCKTYLDSAGKDLCDQERAKIDATLSAVMESRNRIKKELDDLRDEVRKPLTDWENAEAERKGKIESRIETMGRLPEIGSSAESIEKHLRRLEKTEIDESFDEYTAEAALARTKSIRECTSRLEAQIKIEKDAAELEELRIKQAEQAQKDREAEIARQAAEKARVEAGKAAEDARIKAEKEAQEKIREAQRIADEALMRENMAKQQAIDKEKAEKEAKAKAEAEENARIADAEYRQSVIDGVVASFLYEGYADLSVQLANEIAEGKIKNVFIKF